MYLNLFGHHLFNLLLLGTVAITLPTTTNGAITWTSGEIFTPNPRTTAHKYMAVVANPSTGIFHFATSDDGITNKQTMRIGYYNPTTNSIVFVSSFDGVSVATNLFNGINDDIVSILFMLAIEMGRNEVFHHNLIFSLLYLSHIFAVGLLSWSCKYRILLLIALAIIISFLEDIEVIIQIIVARIGLPCFMASILQVPILGRLMKLMAKMDALGQV